jgi:hypothetical protein
VVAGDALETDGSLKWHVYAVRRIEGVRLIRGVARNHL